MKPDAGRATKPIETRHWSQPDGWTCAPDLVAVEAPLAIEAEYGAASERKGVRLVVTMRTPGHDGELAIGHLLTEGIVASRSDIVSAVPCPRDEAHARDLGVAELDVMRVILDSTVTIDPDRHVRSRLMSASCGACAIDGTDWLARGGETAASTESPASVWTTDFLSSATGALLDGQTAFRATGGLHGAAVFHGETCVAVREDIGRHNAVDKAVGAASATTPKENARLLVVSSRAGSEIVMKAIRAGCDGLCAVGAATDLAITLAEDAKLTLIGFARGDRLRVYTHPRRVAGHANAAVS